jgi:hypothetical protein
LDREAEMAITITPLAVDFDPELEKQLRVRSKVQVTGR